MKWMRPLLLVLVFFCADSRVFAWGDEGHETVGAIADQLILHTPAADHVRALLGEESLATAAIWADQIKYRTNQWPEAIEFRNANTNHSAMHYTDIPFEEAKYRDDSIGARPDDIVHAINACILILQGKPQAQTVFSNVNQKIALRLLVHYIGDLHQPLHVGSGYLDHSHFIDPNGFTNAYGEDQGGNQLVFGPRHEKLHFYWDVTVVRNAMTNAGASTPQQFAADLLAKPAPAWQSSAPLLDQDRAWANESLALSAKVHDVNVLQEETYADRYTGKSRVRWPIADLSPEYLTWSAAAAESQITKAGYRLAHTLETIWP
ncbi:MAG TPA: S1/P1 nuclease [Verrucomicrobiae bacterium]|jgi:hypothetical protein|nr:S1/P1 nuclease [Verrucomicrobiae bacterium]